MCLKFETREKKERGEDLGLERRERERQRERKERDRETETETERESEGLSKVTLKVFTMKVYLLSFSHGAGYTPVTHTRAHDMHTLFEPI